MGKRLNGVSNWEISKREFLSVPVSIQPEAHRVARTWVCTRAVGRVKSVDLGSCHFAKTCNFYYYDLDCGLVKLQ